LGYPFRSLNFTGPVFFKTADFRVISEKDKGKKTEAKTAYQSHYLPGSPPGVTADNPVQNTGCIGEAERK
jgi:hypothetical protein